MTDGDQPQSGAPERQHESNTSTRSDWLRGFNTEQYETTDGSSVSASEEPDDVSVADALTSFSQEEADLRETTKYFLSSHL